MGRGRSGLERKGGEEREGRGEWRGGMWSVEGRTHSSIAGEHVEQEWQQGSACSVTSLSGPEPENAGAGGGRGGTERMATDVRYVPHMCVCVCTVCVLQ